MYSQYHSSARCIALLAALCLALPFAQAQNNAALSSPPNGYPVDVPGAAIHLGSEPFEGDLVLSGTGGTLVLAPGAHPVTGNVAINAADETVLVNFDANKQPGLLQVGGSLTLGPTHLPVLALDLSLVGNFTAGETFTIVQAAQIEGHFNGLTDGDAFEVGDVKLRINYADNAITVTVTSAPKRRDRPHRTPVIEMDNSLIDPTSTAPSPW